MFESIVKAGDKLTRIGGKIGSAGMAIIAIGGSIALAGIGVEWIGKLGGVKEVVEVVVEEATDAIE